MVGERAVPFGPARAGVRWLLFVGIVLLGELSTLTLLPALLPGYGAVGYHLAGVAAAAGAVLSLLARSAVPRADPLVSVVLAGVLLLVAWGAAAAGAGPLAVGVLAWLGTVNLALALLGVLPVHRRHRGALAQRLGGLLAGDVMTHRPYVAPGWWTVQTLVEQLLGTDAPRHRAFPVVDSHGRLLGRVHLAEIAAIDPGARRTTTVADIARPVPAELVVGSDTPLERVVRRPHRPAHDIVVVQHDGRVIGLIATTDLQRTAELAALRSDAPVHRVPWNGSIGWE